MSETNVATTSRPAATHARWVLSIAALVLALVWLAMMFGGTGIVDQRVYSALYAGGRPGWVAAAKAVTLLGDPRMLIASTLAAAAWLLWRRHPRTAATLIAVTMVGRGVNSLIKLDVHRPRPALEPHLVTETTNSFPSGHSAGSMIFFLALALLLAHRGRWRRRWAVAAVLTSLLVGLSRIMLGVHWPSDVIGGWAFGALWVIFTLRLTEDLVARDGEGRIKR